MKIIMISVLLFFSGYVSAHHIDQEYKIKFDQDGCVKSLKLLSASNCPEVNNPCKGKKDCACGGKKTKFQWKGKIDKQFDIIFEDSLGTPFDANCKYKSKKDGDKQVVKCKVKNNVVDGDYKYSIKVKHCEIYDPHIIIKSL